MHQYDIRLLFKDERNNTQKIFIEHLDLPVYGQDNLPMNIVIDFIVKYSMTKKEMGFSYIKIVSIEKLKELE